MTAGEIKVIGAVSGLEPTLAGEISDALEGPYTIIEDHSSGEYMLGVWGDGI